MEKNGKMKVVGISNHAKESVAEILIQEHLTLEEANAIADDFNKEVGDFDTYYYSVRPDDYRLWRGMEDLV
jgi:hypothetical protein